MLGPVREAPDPPSKLAGAVAPRSGGAPYACDQLNVKVPFCVMRFSV